MVWCLKRCHVIVGVEIRQWLQLKIYKDFKKPCEPIATFQRSLLPKLQDQFKHKLLTRIFPRKNQRTEKEGIVTKITSFPYKSTNEIYKI